MDKALQACQTREEIDDYLFSGPWLNPSPDTISLALVHMRNLALEEAAQAVKQQWKEFGDPSYHGKGKSIMGGFEERFACDQCKHAIEALMNTPTKESTTM